MFTNIAEDIVLYLSRKKILNQDNVEIYVYAFEVIVLNGTLLTTLLLISILFEQVIVFACYLCFFVPLRVFTGGYHAKNSETCFCISVLSYVVILISLDQNILLVNNIYGVVLTGISMIMMVLYSPLENENHPLEEIQKRRNKVIVSVIIFIDFVLLCIFYFNRMRIIELEIVFIMLNAILFWFQILINQTNIRRDKI